MAKDYGQLSSEVENLVSLNAPRASARLGAGSHQKVKLSTCSMAELPQGTVVDVVPVETGRLSFGDVICGLENRQPVVGRFLGLKGDMLELAQGGRRKLLPCSAALGRVQRAEYRGRDFDPSAQSPVMRLVNRLTRFGTLFSQSA